MPDAAPMPPYGLLLLGGGLPRGLLPRPPTLSLSLPPPPSSSPGSPRGDDDWCEGCDGGVGISKTMSFLFQSTRMLIVAPVPIFSWNVDFILVKIFVGPCHVDLGIIWQDRLAIVHCAAFGRMCHSGGHVLLPLCPAEGHLERAAHWFSDVVDWVPRESFGPQHHLPLYVGLTLWQLHAGLVKHLSPQLHHPRVGARESLLYLPHDHVLDYLITVFLDEPFVVPLPRVVRGGVRLPGLHVLLALP